MPFGSSTVSMQIASQARHETATAPIAQGTKGVLVRRGQASKRSGRLSEGVFTPVTGNGVAA